MNILTKFKTGLRIGLALVLVPFLLSCGGSSDSSSSSNNDGPVQSAARNIASVIETNASGLAGVGGDSEALADLLAAFGITLADNGGEGLSDEFIDLLETLLDDNTAIITQNGNTIEINPSDTQTCNELALSLGFAQTDPIYADCLDAMDDYLITIVTSSSDAGTLSMSFNGHVFLTMDYSPTQLVVALDITESVAALESLILALDPTAIFDTPETLAGMIELDMQVLGEDHGSIQVAITETLQVVDAGEGYDIDVAPATLFLLEADGIAGTASVSSSLSTISAVFPVEVDVLGEVPGDLAFDGANITVNVTDGGDGANGDLSIGPVTFDIDNSGSIESIFSFLLDPEFTVNPDTGVITLDTALELELVVTDDVYNVLLGQNGSLNVDANAGTAFVDAGDGAFEVTSGQMVFAGTGDFVDFAGTVDVGECFDFTGPVTCPEPPINTTPGSLTLSNGGAATLGQTVFSPVDSWLIPSDGLAGDYIHWIDDLAIWDLNNPNPDAGLYLAVYVVTGGLFPEYYVEMTGPGFVTYEGFGTGITVGYNQVTFEGVELDGYDDLGNPEILRLDGTLCYYRANTNYDCEGQI